MSRPSLSAFLEQSGTLGSVIETIAIGCAEIATILRSGDLTGLLGSLKSENVQGETQKQLDVKSNDILVGLLMGHAGVAALASEEMDDILPTPQTAGAYLVAFDPLDGSSNVDTVMSVGTIFSILPAPGGAVKEASFLAPGTGQVAAGYVIYGPQTVLVLTLGKGVFEFTLDPQSGLWLETAANIAMPQGTRMFAINISNRRHWPQAIRGVIDDFLLGKDGPLGQDFNMRWTGSMVADMHRILKQGGVFLYPDDLRNPDNPGKLRLL